MEIKWERATALTDGPKRTLFGKGISPDDAIQGAIGNCWFIAAASAVAEVPGRMEKVFLNRRNKLNEAGIYGVNLYTLGVPHTIIVDDFVPRSAEGEQGEDVNTFARKGVDQSLWGTILEKALAKSMGNYLHSAGGQMYDGVRAITGAPHEEHYHQNMSVEDLWTELTSHDGKQDILNAGTSGENHDNKTNNGLSMGHAYTVLGTVTLDNNDKTRLVKIRNPWGAEGYNGDWGDKSDKWTQADKDKVGFVDNMKDGIFYMSIEDFHKWFSDTQINYDTTNMKHAYFLRLNDNPNGATDCRDELKGPKCFRHELTITSEVEQTVWVNVHTWELNTQPQSC